MHLDVVKWLIFYVHDKYPNIFDAERILECGARNMNGSVKPLFLKAKEYIGVDWIDGPGVTSVGLAHEYRDKPDGYFDLTISTEMLEHDPYWGKSIQRMMELTKEQGTMILTWAADKREPHELECSPQKDYYQNLAIDSVLFHIDKSFEAVEYFNAREGIDLYLLAMRRK